MNLVKVKFTGSRAYRDRTPLANCWNPGDVKPVPEDDARTLCRFVEFERLADAPPQEDERNETEETDITEEEAHALVTQKAVEQQQEDEHNETEGMLLTVESWDKDQLEAYARQYEVEIDKRKSVTKLRQEVSGLIEQFGVR